MKTVDFPFMMIEGFYGRPWTSEDRIHVMRSLSSAGYQSYMYAPKSDSYLREHWWELHPQSQREELRNFARACAGQKMELGFGLSPMGLHHQWDAKGQQSLRNKIQDLLELGAQFIAILFDDMRGDDPQLAQIQAEICIFARSCAPHIKWSMCPSYYTPDPILDLVFGPRPQSYLSDLGQLLPQEFDIYWTGNRVCPALISPQELIEMEQILGRKVFLWDNEPVNDGVRMAPWLHLRAFSGRSPRLRSHLAGHGSNPMVQPHLSAWVQSLLPVLYQEDKELGDQDLLAALPLTVPMGLRAALARDLEIFRTRGVGYGNSPEQYLQWARRIFGMSGWDGLSIDQQQMLSQMQENFESKMEGALSSAQREELLLEYQKWDHPIAREICAYLRFEYAFDPNCLT